MAGVPATAPPKAGFPRLRPGVGLSDGGHDRTGAPGFVLHDPVRHRFYRIPPDAAKLLAGGVVPEQEDADEVARFLKLHRLAEGADAESLGREWRAGQRSVFSRLAHSYLSFRIPLLNPEPLLDAVLPHVRFLASRTFIICILLAGIAGLYFAGRQWDHFAATFMDFLTPQGAALYGVTLVVLKVFHECGHGFVARHFGVRVPVMGINFMVLTPMLYTDASDAWRVASRPQRFLIGAAGVLTEMAIACVALLLWAFLPDGLARSVCFFIAATAWIMSVMVNLSPFMRFDGYHMLVDATGLHSIGPRAFALATWHLRDTLFRTGEAMPEFHPAGRARALIALAWGTWVYRLVLFGGIALLVYHMFPKVIGLPLAAIEIHWFILKPVLRELTIWKGMGMARLFSTGRAKVSLGILLCLVLLAALPLDRHVSVPAVMTPARDMRLFAPEAAQVRALHAAVGDRVVSGEVLAVLEVPEIAFRREAAETRLAISQTRLSRLVADAQALAQRRILEDEAKAAEEELRGLAARGERLVIRAPFSGVVAERLEGLAAGQWVTPDAPLLTLIDPGAAVLNGYVGERESSRLGPRATGRFISDDGLRPAVDVALEGVGHPGGEGPALAYLAAGQGGPILTAPPRAGFPEQPLHGQLPVVLRAEGPAPERALRGMAVMDASPESFLGFALGRVVTVFLRESGF